MVDGRSAGVLTVAEYDAFAMTTALYPGHIGLPYTAIGLCGEAGELANKIKKVLCDDHAGISMRRRAELSARLSEQLSEQDVSDLRAIINGADIVMRDFRAEAIEDELGDILWYVSAVAREVGSTLEVVAIRNMKKLKSRLDSGTLHGDGDKR